MKTHDSAPRISPNVYDSDNIPLSMKEPRNEREAAIQGFTCSPPKPTPEPTPEPAPVTMRKIKLATFVIVFVSTVLWLAK